MLLPGFEPAIPAMKRLQTHPLAHTATGIGRYLAVNLLLKKKSEGNNNRVPWRSLVLGDNLDINTRENYLVNVFRCFRNTLPAVTPKMLLPCSSDVTALPSYI
jgi:hypothetical protein